MRDSVGATFILGKMREPQTHIDAKSSWANVSLTTASPGLILVLLGTTLMITTILARVDVDVHDRSLYIPSTPVVSLSEGRAAPELRPESTAPVRDRAQIIKDVQATRK
jgi:hypothetical protein